MPMKNKNMTKSIKLKNKHRGNLALLFILLCQMGAFAFEYSLSLRDGAFDGMKYNFTLLKIIDGRLDKTKPIGNLNSNLSFSENESVGNDSLCDQMNVFIKKNKANFLDTSYKIIVILNQLNLRLIEGKSFEGKIQDIEIGVSLDYYKITGNKCTLIYQQYFKQRESVKMIAKKSKAINVVFSDAITFALFDFKNQRRVYKPVLAPELELTAFYKLFESRPMQIVTNQNLKNGLYFSIKDIYLNNPGLLTDYTIPDTSKLGLVPIAIKSKTYIIERAYAIVNSKRIFIYVSDNFYKEADIDGEGKLFFPDVTSTSISKEAKVGATAVGIARAILPLGFLGGLASSAVKSSIKKSGATTAVSDVYIDYDTGDMVYK